MDRKSWTGIVEYLVAVVLAVLIALVLAEQFSMPLWGGLSSVTLQ
jgi:hypothetical protein